MKKPPVLSIVIGVLILCGAGVVVWRNLSASGQPGTGASAGRPGARSMTSRSQGHPVETREAVHGTLASIVKLTGEVAAESQISVFPDVGGKIDRVNVAPGSRVAAGAVLLTVDPSQPGTHYEPSAVRAPIAGTVVEIHVERGQTVSTSSVVVTIANVRELELEVRVPERYSAAIRDGTTAKVSFDALPGKSFTAQVKRLQPVLDASSRSKHVVFSIPSEARGIEPGMFARIEIVSSQIAGIIVPFEAVVQEADWNYIYVVRGGKAAKRRVEIGELVGEMIEVRDGITEGESVITSGQGFLEDGSPVTVVTRSAVSGSTAAAKR